MEEPEVAGVVFVALHSRVDALEGPPDSLGALLRLERTWLHPLQWPVCPTALSTVTFRRHHPALLCTQDSGGGLPLTFRPST